MASAPVSWNAVTVPRGVSAATSIDFTSPHVVLGEILKLPFLSSGGVRSTDWASARGGMIGLGAPPRLPANPRPRAGWVAGFVEAEAAGAVVGGAGAAAH